MRPIQNDCVALLITKNESLRLLRFLLFDSLIEHCFNKDSIMLSLGRFHHENVAALSSSHIAASTHRWEVSWTFH